MSIKIYDKSTVVHRQPSKNPVLSVNRSYISINQAGATAMGLDHSDQVAIIEIEELDEKNIYLAKTNSGHGFPLRKVKGGRLCFNNRFLINLLINIAGDEERPQNIHFKLSKEPLVVEGMNLHLIITAEYENKKRLKELRRTSSTQRNGVAV